jgi:hypothetical protein
MRPAAAPGYIERALAMKKRAEAHGATLCAWGAQSFAFELSPEDLEEAVLLAMSAAQDAATAPDERFAVGLAQGAVTPIGEAGPFATLAWGRPLVLAAQLASLARPGEVLVDRELPAVGAGELLSVGARAGRRAGRRVRGVVLDVAEPWRRQASKSVVYLVEPPLVGPAAELDPVVPLGCLAVLRGARGAGGSRALRELGARLEPARVLSVGPSGASLEPLGAVRRALGRAAAVDGVPDLPDRLRDVFERLLSGDGVELASVSALVDAWLSPSGERAGLLAIDDASEVDETSLEALADAINLRGAFRALARIDEAGPLPLPLAGIPAGPLLGLEPLAASDAEALVRGLVGGAIEAPAAERWAARGGGSPLALREAVAEGLSAGELAWRDAGAALRRRSSGRGGAGSARHFIERRLRHVGDDEHALLAALAVLGGDAAEGTLDVVLDHAERPGVRAAVLGESLVAAGWATWPEPGWIRLSSRTARDAIVAQLAPDARTRWHLAAAHALAQGGGLLARADAAWHAAQAGEALLAARHAVEASRAATRAGLDAAALALITFARGHDAALAEMAYAEVRALASWRPPPPPPPSVQAPPPPSSGAISVEPSTRPIPRPPPRADVRVAPRPSAPPPPPPRPSAPPPSARAPGPRPAAMGTPAARAAFAAPRPPSLIPPPAARAEPPATLELAPGFEDEPTTQLSAPAAPPSTDAAAPESALLDPGELAGHLAEEARRALVRRDVGALEQLITRMRATGENDELVERMAAMVALGRGAKAEALSRLRQAADADELQPAHRPRARLAYGVGLAAAGRPEAALLEALTALARARELGDRHGEHACARFLARLSAAAGHPAAAATWARVARLAGAPRGEPG